VASSDREPRGVLGAGEGRLWRPRRGTRSETWRQLALLVRPSVGRSRSVVPLELSCNLPSALPARFSLCPPARPNPQRGATSRIALRAWAGPAPRIGMADPGDRRDRSKSSCRVAASEEPGPPGLSAPLVDCSRWRVYSVIEDASWACHERRAAWRPCRGRRPAVECDPPSALPAWFCLFPPAPAVGTRLRRRPESSAGRYLEDRPTGVGAPRTPHWEGGPPVVEAHSASPPPRRAFPPPTEPAKSPHGLISDSSRGYAVEAAPSRSRTTARRGRLERRAAWRLCRGRRTPVERGSPSALPARSCLFPPARPNAQWGPSAPTPPHWDG
jgi:hypothetical protein